MKPDYQEKTKQKHSHAVYLYEVKPLGMGGETKYGSLASTKDPMSALEAIVEVCKKTPEGVYSALIYPEGDPKHWVVQYFSTEIATSLVEKALTTAKNDKEKLELLKIMETVKEHKELYLLGPEKTRRK